MSRDDRRAVARDGDPAGRQDGLYARQRRGPAPTRPARAAAARRSRRSATAAARRAAARRRDRRAEPAFGGIVCSAPWPRALRDDQRAALGGEPCDRFGRDDVCPGGLAERRLDGGRSAGSTTSSSSRRRPPRPARGPGDPTRLLLGEPRLESVGARPDRGEREPAVAARS